MSYYARRKGGLVRVSTGKYGQQTLQPVPTKTVACDACGWTTVAIDQTLATVLERCICGGTLRVTTAIKEATKLKT